MRSDMAKVIVERPRRGSRHLRYTPLPRQGNCDLDDLPNKEPMKPGRMTVGWRWRKELNEHLGPLKRYLRSQVGRPWNNVYRDISAHLRPSSAVQQHVRDHVWDTVERYVRLDGHRVFRDHGWYVGRRLPLRPGELYIHPVTGILLVAKKPRT